MTEMGQIEGLQRPELSGRYVIRQETLAGARGNGRDARRYSGRSYALAPARQAAHTNRVKRPVRRLRRSSAFLGLAQSLGRPIRYRSTKRFCCLVKNERKRATAFSTDRRQFHRDAGRCNRTFADVSGLHAIRRFQT